MSRPERQAMASPRIPCLPVGRAAPAAAATAAAAAAASAPSAAGFALPLSLLVALLLLLGALSAQTASLQLRNRSGNDQRLAAAEDVLQSAAQQLLGRLNRQHRCLLLLPLEQWPRLEGSCGSGAELAALRGDRVLGSPWQLLAWQPGAGGTADLLLETLPAAGADGQRAQFTVVLSGNPPRIVDLRLRGLRGVTP